MSVINRVLKDLDHQGAAPTTLAGVHAVHTGTPSARPRWPWLALPLVGLAAAWWFWPAPAPQPAAPVQEESTPRLRMSATLSSPTLPARVEDVAGEVASEADTGTAQESLTQAKQPEPTKPPPAREINHGATPTREAPPPIQLDTRLPEPRVAKVIKEVRPLSTGDQAEQAWRQAARLIELGRVQAAQDGLEAALRLDPSHGPARQTLIALSLDAGDTARGESLLREGLQLHPSDPWYHRGLGQLQLQRGDTTQSANILKAGLGKGVDADYWGLYAGVLSKAGRHGEAAQAWREAARLNPTHGSWWIGLAVSLEQTGQRNDAAAAYQRALQTRLSPELRDFAARKTSELAGQ
ncbi:MAG: tetratricopeptide repeat protein [Pseudomonadota bacterium]|nr:tetratricopeptide repeat protein [Pseudomonadota bacterium]MDP1903827.1 tetratricopeptide repeat protein [Pseudomonadota bacterium]MDP2353675.1 tetratricopeptide repeat protein [Pseudomonadota bacterium]